MKIHFISINTLINIPSVRFITDFFIKKYKTSVTITERAVNNENNYYSENENIIFDNIDESKSIEEYTNQSSLKKIKKYFLLLKKINKSIKKSNSDVIFVTPDFQVLFFLIHFKKCYKKKSITIIYLQFELFEYPGKLNAFFYNYILKNGDGIDLAIFPEVNRSKHFVKSCVKQPKKTFILPNSCEPIELKKELKHHSILKEIPNDAYIIGHVGNVGGTDHYFKELIQAAEYLSDENIYFVFIGNQSKDVEKLKNTIKTDNVLFFNKIPHQELTQIYPFFNLGLILYKGLTPNFEFAAPNKLYEYWAYGVPVLAHKLKGLINVFNIQEQGQLIDMNNFKEINKVIRNLRFNENNKKDFLKNYFDDNLSISFFLNNLNILLD